MPEVLAWQGKSGSIRAGTGCAFVPAATNSVVTTVKFTRSEQERIAETLDFMLSEEDNRPATRSK
ncbi:hypothetical protein P3102_22425 [Amycolatopsis sp. QT-25]|uniref:hypothetical protein n=1 Tax=Amycolatopsis sp. QT-25 TaxID=3034022 RepID=UPI0023EB072A|nr:hypothetical protein [Amycolatopsis sp. QT-25]WET76862.1 hypothetical protein P3102_22425 [Amycolatopsis sp. QT-25]